MEWCSQSPELNPSENTYLDCALILPTAMTRKGPVWYGFVPPSVNTNFKTFEIKISGCEFEFWPSIVST